MVALGDRIGDEPAPGVGALAAAWDLAEDLDATVGRRQMVEPDAVIPRASLLRGPSLRHLRV